MFRHLPGETRSTIRKGIGGHEEGGCRCQCSDLHGIQQSEFMSSFCFIHLFSTSNNQSFFCVSFGTTTNYQTKKYTQNVCKYVRKAREFAAANEGSHVTFVSNNTYENNASSLGECFERNAEGMLKNMAIHELALLASFYDVTVDNIESVIVDKDFSSMQTLPGPSGKEFTDFDKVKFTIKTKTGKAVSVQADRCGGDTSYAMVSDANGNEMFRHSMPDEEDKANVSLLEEKYPGAMPYFFSQDPDYITVKERVAKLCATGEEALDIATIDIAIAALSVGEYLTPLMQKELSGTVASQ
jgi:hypothetical protein